MMSWRSWMGTVVLVAFAATAHADEPNLFDAAAAALSEGRYQDAIDQLEAYADRAPVHPDASFNRGIAYVMRVRNGAGKPGDLGRAAAAFEETIALRPDDEQARDALQRVHGEVARQRSKSGKDSLLAKPTLDRVVVNLASERTWGLAAIVSALLLAVGMVLRQKREGAIHLAGTLLIPASVVGLLVLLPLYLGARDLRLTTRTAVVVVREANLTDETGKVTGGDAIPEAARLEVSEQRGRLIRVRYGSIIGWLPLNTVQIIRAS